MMVDRTNQLDDFGCLYGICETLHMAHTGSGEPLDADEAERYTDYLRKRLESWKPSPFPGWRRFDEAMRQLVIAALLEWDKHQPADLLTGANNPPT